MSCTGPFQCIESGLERVAGRGNKRVPVLGKGAANVGAPARPVTSILWGLGSLLGKIRIDITLLCGVEQVVQFNDVTTGSMGYPRDC